MRSAPPSPAPAALAPAPAAAAPASAPPTSPAWDALALTPPAAAGPRPLPAETRAAILEGRFADRGYFRLLYDVRTVKRPETRWEKGVKRTSEVEVEETTIDSVFRAGELEQARRYLDVAWAPNIDLARAAGGSGDTRGKRIEMPEWVHAYQEKLAAQKPGGYVAKSWEKANPAFDDDSRLAQRLVEAFLRAWHRRHRPGEVEIPANVAELYARSGASEEKFGNAQATVLGDPNVYGWCGPATYNAVVLGLFRNGLRFATGKPPVTPAAVEARGTAGFLRNQVKLTNPGLSESELEARYAARLSRIAFMEEVTAQAAFFIANETDKQKGWLNAERFVYGRAAYADYPLQPGDVITQALMNGSPVSGHVLTVIREERDPDFTGEPGTVVSVVYGISGNAGSVGGGAVKSERFVREMPPATLAGQLGPMSGLGNRMTVAVAEQRRAEEKAAAELAKEKKVAPHKVSREEVTARANAAQNARKQGLENDLAEAKRRFQTAAGMSWEDYQKGRAARHPSLQIQGLGRKHKDMIAQIGRLQAGLSAIRDLEAVPAEAAAKGVPYSTTDPLYGQRSGKTGRFRPEQIGHMWVNAIIKASTHANPTSVNAELDAGPAERERRIRELGWSADLSPAEYRRLTLERHGMEPLGGTIESLWPGALGELEGRQGR